MEVRAIPNMRTLWFLLLLMWTTICVVFVLHHPIFCKPRDYIVVSHEHFEEELPPTENNASGEDLQMFFHLKPNVDRSPHPYDIEKLQRENPNLPIAFWNNHKVWPMYYNNRSCAKFPNIIDLKFNNRYWQVLQTTNGTFQLYGAYYEARELSEIKPAVRILALIDRLAPTVKTFCQLWFKNSNQPVFADVVEYNYLWKRSWGDYGQGIYHSYLIACKIPSEYENEVPASVSLVENQCDMASNLLRVIYNKVDVKKDFAVCVKGLDMSQIDLSVRIVEWIEVIGALGADKIFFYELQVHSNISKVLQYYKDLGRVDVTPLTLPAEQPNLPPLQHMFLTNRVYYKRQSELIPLNDCFYKNMYAYRYVILLDIDEVIVPNNVGSWKELMDIVEVKAFAKKRETPDVYSARNVYFFDDYPEKLGWFEDIPRYMHILQHAYRTMNFTLPFYYVKSFFNTEKSLGLNHHYSFTCLNKCNRYEIPISDAKLHHYRGDCVPYLRRVCGAFRKNVVNDTSIWKVKDKVIEGTINTLKTLGFFSTKRKSI